MIKWEGEGSSQPGQGSGIKSINTRFEISQDGVKFVPYIEGSSKD